MQTWNDEPSWLPFVADESLLPEILSLRKTFKEKLQSPQFSRYAKSLEMAPAIDVSHIDFRSDAITIESQGLSQACKEQVKAALQEFCPWRKGPFHIFGESIDSEWQSQLKWDRIEPFIAPLENKVVADIGCNNGYFMFRMQPHKPKAVIGFEPVAKHWFNFHLIQKYCQCPELHFEMFGVEHLDLFPKTFDTIFCMGILYHHTDPMSLLRKMKLSLKKGGEIIIDCQGIPGDDDIALVPRSRYAGAKGVWFLPTLNGLINWVRRAGMEAKLIYSGPLSIEEQRTTPWANIKSLKDFLSEDLSQTVEGYPAPHRFYLIAK